MPHEPLDGSQGRFRAHVLRCTHMRAADCGWLLCHCKLNDVLRTAAKGMYLRHAAELCIESVAGTSCNECATCMVSAAGDAWMATVDTRLLNRVQMCGYAYCAEQHIIVPLNRVHSALTMYGSPTPESCTESRIFLSNTWQHRRTLHCSATALKLYR